MIQQKALKPRKCKHCREPYTPSKPMQTACSIPCALALAQKAKEKAQAVKAKEERKADRERKEKLKSISAIEAECRRIVQKIARIRDRNDECISCDKPASWSGQWHGSHFRAHGGCSSLQFHLWNIHKACWICNSLYSGNTGPYEEKLRVKLGNEKVDWLKVQPKSQRFSREYLERFKKVMGKRLRRMDR